VKPQQPLDYATPPPPPSGRIDWDFWFIISIPVVLVVLLALACVTIWSTP